MSRSEKYAWFSLAVSATAVAAFLVLAAMIGPARATGAFGVMGLQGIAPLMWGIGRKDGRQFDERDAAIQTRSWHIGYTVFWLAFVGACMYLWGFVGDRRIPGEVFGAFPLVGWALLSLAQSSAALVLYRRGG